MAKMTSTAGENLSKPEDWVAEYGDYLFRYAIVRLRNSEAAEDAVQETFLAALKARDSFSKRSSPKTWLVGILRHKIIDYIRKQSRERPATELESADSDSAMDDLFDRRGHWKMDALGDAPGEWPDNPRKALAQKEFRAVLDSCMSNLPGRLAQAFALREIEGFKGKEVGKALDIPPTNLWAMLRRARMRLRRCLDINWFGKPSKGK